MIRYALFLIIALLGLATSDAAAAEIRLSYKAIVTQANGAQASSFAPGQEIEFNYTLETTATDSNPNSNAGVFLGGLRQMQIAIPAAGVSVVAGPGIVQTFNDVGSDQMFLYSSGVGGSIGGLPVAYSEIDFVDYEQDPDGKFSMLASDALPITHLIASDNSISFQTSAGFTSIRFLAEPAASCASEGYSGTKLTWCQNICENGLVGPALDTWIHRWIARYRILPACALAAQAN